MRKDKIALVLILFLIFFLNVFSMWNKSITYDEPKHIEYGKKILKLNSDRANNSTTMPITALNAIPVRLKEIIIGRESNMNDFDLRVCRSITILFSVFLGLIVFLWSRSLYGSAGGFFSLLLYAFSPNIIAHSRLVTTDLYAALMCTVSCYWFWKFLITPTKIKGFLSACFLGVSQLVKYSCLGLYPVFLLITFIRYIGLKKKSFRDIGVFLAWSSVFLLISIVIINTGFLFYKTGMVLNENDFVSILFKTVCGKVLFFNHLPVFLPYQYINGMDIVSFISENNWNPTVYLLGQLSKNGFKGYYLYAFLFKVPVAIQIFVLLGCINYVIQWKKYEFFQNEIFLIIPVLFFGIFLNWFFKVQVGIRYLIIVFPMIFILCGSLLKNYNKFSKLFKACIAMLLMYLAVSVLSYFPHYISYFNEFVIDRKQAYLLLADSNIDWGQDQRYLKEYMDKNPNAVLNPPGPMVGEKIIVNVNMLVGLDPIGPDSCKWLREMFEPIDHIGYSYLVYNVTPEQLEIYKKSKGET